MINGTTKHRLSTLQDELKVINEDLLEYDLYGIQKRVENLLIDLSSLVNTVQHFPVSSPTK